MSKKNRKDKITELESVEVGKPEVAEAEEHGYPPIDERDALETTALQEPTPAVGTFPFLDEEAAQEVATIPGTLRRNRPNGAHIDNDIDSSIDDHVDRVPGQEDIGPMGQAVEGVEDTNLDLISPVTEGRATAETAARPGVLTGITGIGLSVLSLFIFPFVMSSAGVITGFFAFRQGARTLGWWAIGIGVVALLGSLLFAPYFR